MHIVFRVDASDKIGTGHVYRCLFFAHHYAKNHSISFICKKHSFHLIEKIKEKYPKVIREIRCEGFTTGLKLISYNSQFLKTLMEHKMLTPKAEENVIRLFPSLIVKKNELDEATHIIETVCKEMV